MGNLRCALILLASAALSACGGGGSSHRGGGEPGADTLTLTLRVSDGQVPIERALTVRDLGTGARYSLTTDEQGEVLFEQAASGPLVIGVAASEGRAPITGFVTKPDRVAGWVISLSPLAEAIHLAAIGQMLDNALLTDALALPGEALPEVTADWWLSAEAGLDAAPALVLDALTPVLGRTAARACLALETADCRNPLAGPDSEDYRNELDLLLAPLDLAGGYTLDEQGVAQFGAVNLPLWSGDYEAAAGAMHDAAPLVQWPLPAYWRWTLDNETTADIHVPTDMHGNLPVLGRFGEWLPQWSGEPLSSDDDVTALLAMLMSLYGGEVDPENAQVSMNWRGTGLTGTRLTAQLAMPMVLWEGEPVMVESLLTLQAVDMPVRPRTLSGKVWFGAQGGEAEVEVLSTLLETARVSTDNEGMFSLTVSGQPLLVRASQDDGETLYALVGASEFDSWVNVSTLTDATARSLATRYGDGSLPGSWMTARPGLVAGYYEDIGPLARRITERAHALLGATGVTDDVPLLWAANPFYAREGTCPGETGGLHCQARILSVLGECGALAGAATGIDCASGVISVEDEVHWEAGVYMAETQAMQIVTRPWTALGVMRYQMQGQAEDYGLSAVGNDVRVPLSRQHLMDTALAAMVRMSSVFQDHPLNTDDTLLLDNPAAFLGAITGFGDDGWLDLVLGTEEGGEDLIGRVLNADGEEVGTFTASSLYLRPPPM